MSNLKLGVEVVGAHDLVPKDGQGSSSAYVELLFDRQKFRTTVKDKDLNPVWNESFFFNISDPQNLAALPLEAFVFHHGKGNSGNSGTCLGKVCLTGTSFVPYSDAVVLHYPLEKRRLLSRVKGELGLKVFVTDDSNARVSNPLPAMPMPMPVPSFVADAFADEKPEKRRHTFRSIPADQKSAPKPVTEAAMASEMRSAQAPGMFSGFPASQSADYLLKETSPYLGGGQVIGGRVFPGGNRPTSTYDLVEKMQYLFIRVVRARDLPSKDVTGSLDPYVEVKIGNFTGKTKHFEKRNNPEWNEVFAFAKENLQSSVLEVVLKDKDVLVDDYVGNVRFDLNEIPTRVPPDSPLAAEWYRLSEKDGSRVKKGEVMLAVWYGTQADEAFPDAWHSDAVGPTENIPSSMAHLRSKVYHAPRLWYVRVNVVEAQDLVTSDKSRIPDTYVKIHIGSQIQRTKPIQARGRNPVWNEDVMFVAAEPFDEPLIISVEDRVGAGKDDTLGRAVIYLNTVEKRADNRNIRSKWFPLEKSMSAAMEESEPGLKKEKDKDKFSSRIHLRVCLDGGYHVFDESMHHSSDLRPTAKQLWKPSIGVLELGILNADGLQPMKTREGRGTADTYCVAKYGHKWVRTRTIVNSLTPKYNEQYTWEVHDPATVLTIGVFDNAQLGAANGHNKDVKVGKVRVRISTLQTGRVYTHSYPMLVLHPSGVKKMGELHLAIRFSCSSLTNMMFKYSRPVLPKMHYVRPLTAMQQEWLRHQAVSIAAARLGRAEPPLRREVVEYMSDADAHLWSMRRSKANFFRLMSVFSGFISVGKWLGEVCQWKNAVTTSLVHALFVMLVCFPELILPTVFLYMTLIGLWNFRYRPKYPPHMNTRMAHADAVNPDELDEEFDTFPSSRSSDLVRMRYDRLRSVAGRIQAVVGDVAAQGERVQALLSWRDPRATAIFIVVCMVAAVVLYVTPFQVVALGGGFYFMRHPRFRHKTPSMPMNFFRRLPARTDSMF